MDRDLLDFAGDIADGQTPEWSELEGDTSLGNLKKLQKLSQAFGAAREGSMAGQGAPEFKWCHLEVYEQIGSGGFGEVYRAFDPVLSREVALKLRRTPHTGTSDQILIQEARRMARVRHPNVLAVHGSDIDGGRPGIWCDLLRGQTLEALLAQKGKLNTNALLSLALPLASALVAIHKRDLVHGDIKAANVMLQGDGTPILMDFGAGADQSTVSSGPTLGSPLVMAPESLAGAGSHPSGDVYSLGVLFYRLLIGSYPVMSDDLEGLKKAHERGLKIDWTRVPRAYRKLLQQMLAADSNQRPQATDVVTALAEIQMRPERRRKTAAIAMVIIALGAGMLAAGFGYYRATQSAERALSAQAESQYALDFMQSLLASPTGINDGINVRVADVIDRARRELEFAPPKSLARRASIANTLGQTYASLGQHETANRLLTSAISIMERQPGQPNEDLIRMRINLGWNAEQTNQYQRALAILEQAEREARTVLGEGHPLQVEALLRIGEVYGSTGPVDLEEQAYAKAAALSDRSENPSIIPAMIRLRQASIYMRKDLTQAEQFAREARAWIIEREGEKSSNTVAASDQLAVILIERGRFDEAEDLLRANLEIIQQRLPEGSAKAVQNLSHLSIVLDRRGLAEEALDFNMRALEMAGRLFGESADDTFVIRANLAVRLQALGRMDEAESAYRRVIADVTKAHGGTHPNVLITKGNLAELLLITGQLDKSEEVARDAYLKDQETLGEDHLFTLFAMDILGAALCRQGNSEEGVPLLRRAHELKSANFGADNPYTHDTAFYLAEALLGSGSAGEAVSLLEGVVANRTKDLGAEHANTKAAMALLESARAAAGSGIGATRS